eukprot:CAMPEP_0206158256 /NCGR_PEP_ID=MMETSP1474-20131121/4663_1 /ASSEMBLY_ACC=CAM_ASM_001110 /TAXON_ID=97495 /ORGANISM="Imantonia sp., Strain RCC918" /LENGTH=232 /DNA_ID=CAMNT_0053558221 /DNA_START=328 /DNA_END=1026 /DNA_ORIENTATION=+
MRSPFQPTHSAVHQPAPSSGVGEDVGERGQDGLARHERLVQHARERKHRKPPVLELCQLQAVARGRVLAEFERVEAQVARNALRVLEHVHHRVLALVADDLEPRHEEDDLHEPLRRHRGEGLHLVGRVARVARHLEELLENDPRRREHADAAVLELGLAQPLDVEEVGEVQWVEAGLSARQAARLARGRSQEGKRLRGLRDSHAHARLLQRHGGRRADERGRESGVGGEHRC